jgi:hypothetical protein
MFSATSSTGGNRTGMRREPPAASSAMPVIAAPAGPSEDFATRQAAGDKPVRREGGVDLAAVLGHDLFLDASRTAAVVGAFPGLEREHHAFAQRRVLSAEALREDRPSPQRQADAMFGTSGKSIPALATSDGYSLGCFWTDNQKDNPDFKLFTVATGNDNVHLAVQWAVASVTGGQLPTEEVFKAPVFEDSVSANPNPVQCRNDLPGAIYLLRTAG